MKGYARVDIFDAIQARGNFLQWLEDVEKLFEKYCEDFYKEWYPKQNFISRYLNKNKTPEEFFYLNVARYGFDYWVYGDDEISVNLSMYYWYRWEVEKKSKAVESLYKATKDDYILVDQTLAAHINKWKNYKIGESE